MKKIASGNFRNVIGTIAPVKVLCHSWNKYLNLGDTALEYWAVLQHNNMALCLFQGHIDKNLINFRGGDIEAIHKEATSRGLKFSKPAKLHPDGSWSAEVLDPDGNVIFFNTFPDEREKYINTGKLIDY
jgi:hypothetical protein